MVSTTSARIQTRVTSYEQARTQLLGWGVFMMCIYAIYVLVFPLVPTIYQSERVLDIEMMLRDGRKWFAPLYVLGLGGLFYAYWRVMQIVHSLSREEPEKARSLRAWVLGIGALSAVLLLGLYPITALDVVLYVVRARVWALYGGSPMLAVPSEFPQDLYIRFAGEYHSEVSPYGPLWELVAQIPIRPGILDISGGVLAMKVISLISYVGMAVLLGWYARQDSSQLKISRLTALTFFALNPLVLMEAVGNGHNDMLMLAFITLGLVLWQRGRWAWATLALTLAALVKITGLILMPLFGVAVLAAAPTWQERLRRGLGIAAIFAITTLSSYRLTGPFPEVLDGARYAMFDRWGYTPAFMIRVIAREIYQDDGRIAGVLGNFTHIFFAIYFGFLVIRVAQRKMNLIEAGFLAFFSQLLLGTTFRIWYPLWLMPFAALGLNSRTFWRTFLFSLTAELSILMYLVVWRWKLDMWEWGLNGPLGAFWKFRTVTTVITVPWLFGVPLLGPLLCKWKDASRFKNTLWI